MKFPLSENCHSLVSVCRTILKATPQISLIVAIFLFFSCGEGSQPNAVADSTGADISLLEKSIQNYPDSAPLKTQLADAYESAGKTEEAINYYDSLLATDSLNALWYNRKASLYLSLGDTASALSTLQSSINVQPAQGDILLEMGFLYADKKNDSALRISDILQRSATDPLLVTNAIYLNGIYYSNTGETEKALKAFDACIIHDYTFIDAYLEKGILLYNIKKYPEALSTFEKARTVSNTNADAYFWTGKTYEAMNQKPEAIDFYKKALGLDDKLTEAAERLRKLE